MRGWQLERRTENKLMSFLGVLFFLFLADAMLSDWIPGFVQEITKSPLLMGLVVSLSSVMGLIMDFVFAEILEGKKLRKIIWWAWMGCVSLAGWLGLTVLKPWLLWLVLGMASWGIYFDLFNFLSQKFVIENVKREERSAVWGVVGMVRNLAYFLGPLIGTGLTLSGETKVLWGAGLALAIAGIGLGLLPQKVVEKEKRISYAKLSFKTELKHWLVLAEHVWPLLVMSLLLNFIDATYWTTGTIVTDKLAQENWWGSLFLSFYVLPFLFVGGWLAKFKIVKGKKKLALRTMVGAGLLLGLMMVSGKVWWKLGIVLFSSTLLAVSWPMVNAVYSDLIVRMKREREMLVGLSDSMMNVAYVIGPVLAGWIASLVGEEKTFMVVGLMMAVVSLSLWLIMPKKLKLPQKEIETWKEQEE